MLDAVSAHTDCLIQIVKERRSFGLRGVVFYSAALESSLIFKGFSRLSTGFALLLALSMEAHYRERIVLGNPSLQIKLQKSALF